MREEKRARGGWMEQKTNEKEGELLERRDEYFEYLKELKLREYEKRQERKEKSNSWKRWLVFIPGGGAAVARLEDVKQAYFQYRREHGMKLSCDQEGCLLNVPEEPTWVGKKIRMVVTKKGDQYDYRPQSLFLLCPNCFAQYNEARKKKGLEERKAAKAREKEARGRRKK